MTPPARAAMVLFYDIEGDATDHDDWHSREHFHERLSVPGFLRATRWLSTGEGPRCLAIYELADVGVSTSPAYLARLNDPSDWTQATMPRFRGMVRGFGTVVARAGFGLGAHAAVLRFAPAAGQEETASRRLGEEVLPALASRRGLSGARLMRPAAPPPMTAEQALRGADRPLPWLVVASAWDPEALDRAVAEDLAPDALLAHGIAAEGAALRYALHATADASEAAATPAPETIAPDRRRDRGPRL